MRAATSIRSRRMVAPRARAWNAEAKHPAARTRLCAMAARVSQAAFAASDPRADGPGATGQVREDLLHQGVVAVVALGLEQPYLELSRQPGL